MFDQDYTNKIFQEIINEHNINETRYPKLTRASIAVGSIAIMAVDSLTDRYSRRIGKIGYETVSIETRSKIGAGVIGGVGMLIGFSSFAPTISQITHSASEALLNRIGDAYSGLNPRPR